jgi:hypothetical protein
VFQRAAAGPTAAGLVAPHGAERREIAQVGVRNQDDVASWPPVATVGPSLRNVLLPAEVQAPVAATTRLNPDLGSIMKHATTVAALHSEPWMTAGRKH